MKRVTRSVYHVSNENKQTWVINHLDIRGVMMHG